MDQPGIGLWISCGSAVDQLGFSCGSGSGSAVDQLWIGLWISCGSAVDQLWISCGSAGVQLGFRQMDQVRQRTS